MNLAIDVKSLNKTFGKFQALDNVDFQVYENECFGLLGPNGAGKSTTMKILYGMNLPDKNKITKISVLGLDPLRDNLKIKYLSGVVPQQDNLDTELSVRNNLLLYSKFYGIKKNVANKRIDELLEFMELTEKAHVKIDSLSGGMKRRLTIARALINKPKLLFLDEPTTGLDPQVRHLIWNKLRELKEDGVSILLTTHYMEEAFQICDRISIMDKGKKVICGNPRTLLSKNIENFVMEVYGENINSEIQIGKRHEFYNNTLFVFGDTYEELQKVAISFKEREHYIRQANLEDLFLKVTGRSLNELQ